MYLYDRIATKTLIKTHVFNLSNGERRCIYFPYVYNQFNIDKISTFANGSLYWLNNNLTITALDLHTELFYEVSPPSCFTKYSNKVYLWSLKDRLCLCEMEDVSVNYQIQLDYKNKNTFPITQSFFPKTSTSISRELLTKKEQDGTNNTPTCIYGV